MWFVNATWSCPRVSLKELKLFAESFKESPVWSISDASSCWEIVSTFGKDVSLNAIAPSKLGIVVDSKAVGALLEVAVSDFVNIDFLISLKVSVIDRKQSLKSCSPSGSLMVRERNSVSGFPFQHLSELVGIRRWKVELSKKDSPAIAVASGKNCRKAW
jgi:hypothetical protein